MSHRPAPARTPVAATFAAPSPYALPLAHEAEVDAVRHWESLLDRGLIGQRAPIEPDALASLLHDDALFRARAAWRR